MLPISRLTMTLGLAGVIALAGCSGDDDGGDDITPTGVTISSFTATPTTVAPGGQVQLAWNVARADSVTINAEPGGEVTTSTDLVGSVMATVNANTTFTLVATGGGKTAMRSVSVTVSADAPPSIQSFTATPMAAGAGTTVTLRWSATNGNQVRIVQGGNELLNSTTMANGGSLPVTMGNADTTYDLEVSNANGMDTESVTVTLVQAATEVEPNNDAASANDANLGGGVSGELTVDDEDWFSFAVTEGGNVFAQTDDGAGACTASTADTVLELYGPDGTTLITGNDDGANPPCSTIDPALNPDAAELPAGTYYIRVTGYPGDRATGTYRLVVVVGEGPDCGNGILEANSGEVCDDGNTVGGDGCSATCGTEVEGAGSFSLSIDVPPAGTLIPVVLTTMGQSITATTSDGSGACPYPTLLVLGDADLMSLGQVNAEGGCANIDPRVDAFAAVLDAGTYYIYVAGETEAQFGPLTVDITISDPGCGNGIFEPDFNEQCEDGNTMSGDGCSSTCTVEPIGTVTGLNQDMTFTGALTPVGNQDFYEVVIPSDSYIRAVTGVPTIGTCMGGDTVATILDSTFTQVARNDDFGGEACSNVVSPLVAGGTYYVRIEEFGNNAEIASYQVQITTFGAGCGNGVVDAGESCDDGNTTPGDGCDASCMIEADGTVTGLNQDQTFTDALTPIGDQDIFAVVLPSDGYIIAETGAPTMGVCENDDTVIRILDPSGTTIASNDEGGINSCSLYDGLAAAQLLPAGTYFVRVEEFLNDAEIAAYQINIQTVGTGCGNGAVEPGEQCDDGNTTPGDGCDAACMFEGNILTETEANDTIATANASGVTIGNTVTVSGSIGTVGDVDYYSFTVPAGQTASLSAVTYTAVGDTSACTIGDTNIFLFDSAMTELANNDDANGLCSEIDPMLDTGAAGLAAGTYYIRVQHYDNTESFGPYLMDISLQ